MIVTNSLKSNRIKTHFCFSRKEKEIFMGFNKYSRLVRIWITLLTLAIATVIFAPFALFGALVGLTGALKVAQADRLYAYSLVEVWLLFLGVGGLAGLGGMWIATLFKRRILAKKMLRRAVCISLISGIASALSLVVTMGSEEFMEFSYITFLLIALIVMGCYSTYELGKEEFL
jgi:hypothetical protein